VSSRHDKAGKSTFVETVKAPNVLGNASMPA